MEEVEEKILIKSLIAENIIEQNSKRKFDIGFLWEGKKGRRKLNEFEHEV